MGQSSQESPAVVRINSLAASAHGSIDDVELGRAVEEEANSPVAVVGNRVVGGEELAATPAAPSLARPSPDEPDKTEGSPAALFEASRIPPSVPADQAACEGGTSVVVA